MSLGAAGGASLTLGEPWSPSREAFGPSLVWVSTNYESKVLKFIIDSNPSFMASTNLILGVAMGIKQ